MRTNQQIADDLRAKARQHDSVEEQYRDYRVEDAATLMREAADRLERPPIDCFGLPIGTWRNSWGENWGTSPLRDAYRIWSSGERGGFFDAEALRKAIEEAIPKRPKELDKVYFFRGTRDEFLDRLRAQGIEFARHEDPDRPTFHSIARMAGCLDVVERADLGMVLVGTPEAFRRMEEMGGPWNSPNIGKFWFKEWSERARPESGSDPAPENRDDVPPT